MASYYCHVKYDLGHSLIVEIDDKMVTIPKNFIKEGTEVQEPGDEGEVELPDWFAEDEGLE